MSDLADLYPFLDDGSARRGDPAPVLADVRSSTLLKSRDISELRQALWERHGDDLVGAAHLLARSLAAGKKVLSFGNGGSATDAQDVAADLSTPPLGDWTAFPAIDLTRDVGVVTAVGNDVGFGSVFVRQVIAYGEPGDVALGFSTSGESPNVTAALETARSLGLGTIAFSGGDGGRLAVMGEEGAVDFVIVAPSAHIPRIQEAHATAYHALLAMAQAYLRNARAA